MGVLVASSEASEAVIDGRFCATLAKVGMILRIVAFEPPLIGSKDGSARGMAAIGALRMSSGVRPGSTAPGGN